MIKKILSLLLFLPLSLFAWKMESGTVSLPVVTSGSSTWQTVTLQQTYDTAPLIFALPDEGGDYNGDSPAALRVRNVGTESFEIVQVEPQSSIGDVEGEHAAMKVHYIAIESGDHTLPDGTRILAGSHSTTTKEGKNVSDPRGWDNISLSPAFSATPIVLSMIQSLVNENNILSGTSSSPWMTAHIKDVSGSDFDITLDRAETSSGSVTSNETIGYLAIDSSVSSTIVDPSCQSVSYQTINTGDNVQGWANSCYSQSFGTTYSSSPNVVGSMQSRDGGDGGWLRRCNLSNSTVGITVDEDQAADSERSHTTETVGLVVFSQDFIYDSTVDVLGCGLITEYRMDECYWLDNAGGVTGDVKDSSQNGYDATSYNTASVSVGQINSAGLFSSDGDLAETENVTAGETPGSLSVSFWAKLDQQLGRYAVVLTKSKDWDWNDGWGFVNPNGSASDTLRFYINKYSGTHIDTTLTTADGWAHFTGTYDGENLRLYKNGVEVTGSPVLDNSGITNSNDPIRMAFDNSGDATLKGNLDEVKIWNRALGNEEIARIEGNETIGNNYDGTPREPVACGATVAANSWELVGIPIDLRTDPKTVAETFQGMGGIYGTDWRIYRRDYSDTNNSSWYTYLGDPDSNMTEFGKAYWLGNKQTAQNWNVDGTQAVDYDSSFNGTSDCVANRCVELDIKSASLDEASDDLNGTGSYRYNMTGFVGKTPVDWADCRFIIDGTVYTPTEAETEGYAAKQIWQYNPSGGNDYTTCDDTMACKLIPFEGFWIELHGKTKNKTVKLLIPQE